MTRDREARALPGHHRPFGAANSPCEACGVQLVAVDSPTGRYLRHAQNTFVGSYEARRTKPISDMATIFWRHVTPTEGCWIWSGARSHNGQGYGHMKVGGRNGRDVVASRASWEIHNGPIPDGLFVLHDCDNPPCVNPAHLHLGTRSDNVREALERGLLVPTTRRKVAA